MGGAAVKGCPPFVTVDGFLCFLWTEDDNFLLPAVASGASQVGYSMLWLLWR
jgi:hypothetical protein